MENYAPWTKVHFLFKNTCGTRCSYFSESVNMGKEQIFPRGGKRARQDDVPKEEDLFKTAESASAPKKRKMKVKQPKGKSKQTAPPSKSKHTDVDHLTFQMLTEGMLVFGRVKEVQDYKVMVSLPHGLLGTLPITAISQLYTQHLQAIADSDVEDDQEDIPTLKDLFKVGDGLQCRIMTLWSKNKRFVELSADPEVINKDLPISALKNGCLLYGTIQSVEDHGCAIDIGIPGIKAFLTTSTSVEGGLWNEGKGVWCSVKSQSSLEMMSGETRVISLTADNVLESEVSPQSVSSLECLRPGMKVKATVEKVLKDGLYVRCIKYRGCVYKTHLPQGLSQYSTGQKVEGRILFTNPVSKVISLSLLPGINGCIQPQEEPFAGLSIGDFVDDAEVMFVDKTSAVFLRLPQGCTALAPLIHLSDKDIKDVNQAFTRGSKHRCRVISFQPADDVVLVSMKESIMKQKILSIKDIQPGQIVECTVEAVHSSGVIVLLGKGLTGLIPTMHVSDIPLKNIAKKFTKGDKLKCRVLKVNVSAKKVYLTKKKSIVTTNKTVPCSYSGLVPDMLLEGYIIAVQNNGVAVGFCNEVTGWVPKHELSSVEITDPATAFYKGQVVRCRVVSCQPEAQKLRLSLIISGKAAIGSKSEKMADFVVGTLVSAKVSKKLAKNLEVELQPSGTKALLPQEHLSDSAGNQVLMWQALKPGDHLDSVMMLKHTNLPIITLKESFLSAARECGLPQSVQDLQPGQLLPGVIKNHQSYGIFVELPGALGGLAPHKFTMNQPAGDLTKFFVSGQSVVVKVMEVKEDKGRFLCSLRMCDCYHDEVKVGLDMLETYLNERDHYLQYVLPQKASGLSTGSLLKVTVKEKSKDGYICETAFGMPAIITKHHTGEAELPIGCEVEGVVLHIAVDQSNSCLEMSSDSALVRAVSRRKEKPTMDKARKGQTIKSEVVLIKEDFVLVALKQHATGSLAWLPRRQHLNDVLASTTSNFEVGEETKVTIQKSEGDRILAILSSLAKEEEAHPNHTLQLGQMVSARIQSILPSQMNIMIGNVKARVHVTEVIDEVENGMFPFSKYAKGQNIKVKIIGFRHFKSFKYLPLSHPRIHKAMPECSLKPSKLQIQGCPEQDQASYFNSYKPGDTVKAFVTQYENNKLWVSVSPTRSGVLSVFDLSRDLGVLKHAEKHFSPGRGYVATVLGVEEEGDLVHLSLTGKREVVKKNSVVTGKVTSVSEKGIALRLPADFRGMVPAEGENTTMWKHITVGSFLRCLVLSSKDKDDCLLSLNLTHRSEDELKALQKSRSKRKRSVSESSDADKPRKRQKSEQQKSESDAEDKPLQIASPSASERGMSGEEAATDRCLSVDTGFLWDQVPVDNSPDSEEEDDDDEEEATKKGKQATGNVKAGGQEGKDFGKLLASHPNDSKLWIQYMVDQLNQGKVNTARSLANQALQTIAIEEQQEKLNVWIALLNLENMYGSKEDVGKTLQRALQVTDPLKLYRRVAAMYTASGNVEEAEQIHKTMVRRYKQDRQVWIDYGLFLFKNGQLDAARKLLQRALLSIERKDHVTTITQFASLECKHGEAERGFTMFDKVLTEFPKRFDVMTVYTDMVVLKGDLDKARELFEKSWSLKPSTRLFKKYVQFEEKNGTEESLARLQSRIENEAL